MSPTTVAVVTRDKFVTWEMKALYRAARRAGFALRVLDPTAYSFDLSLRRMVGADLAPVRPTSVLGRVDLDALVDGTRLLSLLEMSDVPVVNGAEAFRVGRDKALASAVLARAGLPHPPTYLVGRGTTPSALKMFSYPLVVKPTSGSRGVGVHKVDDARRLSAAIAASQAPLYVQAWCPDILRELRVLTLGDRVLGAIQKTPAKGEWRANLAQGATGRTVELQDSHRRLALRSAQAIGAQFTGVDLVDTPTGTAILEVNVCPSFHGVCRTTGIDVAQEVVSYMMNSV